jgi:hypothetical protein
MLWALMMLAFFRFDGDLGGVGFSRGAGGSLQAHDGMTGIPPRVNDGMVGIPPTSTYRTLDGMVGIPPR